MADGVLGRIAALLRAAAARRQSSPEVAAPFAAPPAALTVLTVLDDIDLTSRPSPYGQPDRTTCGSCCLVLARMINHPDYAHTILTPDVTTGAASVAEHFHADVLAMHELTNAMRDETGRWQPPWPKALGTQPWAVAARMSEAGGCGVVGTRYHVVFADPRHLEVHLDAIAAATGAGHSVAVFIGDQRSPRHVVLALPGGSPEPGAMEFYNPSSGVREAVPRSAIVGAAMDLAGWDQVWMSILPR